MNELSINGRKLAFTDEGNGPAILFGHSFLWTHDMWREQLSRFSADHRCIAPDLWAHGASELPPEAPYSLEQIAEDHYTLMQQLGVDRFAVAGLSIGGMWGLRLALRHPEAVSALILMDTDAGTEAESTRAQYLGMLDAITQLKTVPPPIINKIAPGFFSPQTIQNRPELLAGFQDSLAAVPGPQIPGIVTTGRSFVERESILDQLPRIACPALVLVGADDVYRPVAEAERITDSIPNATLEVIPNAGHISALEQAEAVNTAIARFLNSIDS